MYIYSNNWDKIVAQRFAQRKIQEGQRVIVNYWHNFNKKDNDTNVEKILVVANEITILRKLPYYALQRVELQTFDWKLQSLPIIYAIVQKRIMIIQN